MRNVLCCMVILFGLATESQAQNSGPIRLGLTALLVAPGKDSGLPWDGPGELSPEIREKAMVHPGNTQALIGALTGLHGAPLLALAGVLPWAVTAFTRGMAAPDVKATIFFNGVPVAYARKVANHFHPSWADVYTQPLTIGDNDIISIEATDVDLQFDDQIGTCTITGRPEVDRNKYILARSIVCQGQLWAVAMTATSVDTPSDSAPIVSAPPAPSMARQLRLSPGLAYELYATVQQANGAVISLPLDVAFQTPNAHYGLRYDNSQGGGFLSVGPGGAAITMAGNLYPGQTSEGALGTSAWIAAYTRKGPMLINGQILTSVMQRAAAARGQ